MKNIPKLIIGLLLMCLMLSCKRDNFDSYVGPALCPTESFAVKSPFRVSVENIDFDGVSGIYGDSLLAEFSEEVTWKITLTGKSSGATKAFTGRSAIIDTVWFGQSSSFDKLFQTGEDVEAKLSVSCRQETYSQNIKLIKTASKFNLSTWPFLLVSDFDGNGYVPNSFKLPVHKDGTDEILVSGYNGAGWSSYFTPSSGVLHKFDVGTELSAPQGSNYMTIQGVAKPTSWFVGGAYINTPSFPITNPKDLYFNALINPGNNTTTTLSITLKVSDNEKYNYVFPIKWTGWRPVAIKITDFKNSLGASINDMSRLTAFDFGLNCASKQGQATEVNMDYIMISNGGPFFK